MGRWGWHEVAKQLGVDSGPIVPLTAVALVALATIVVAVLLALLPAHRASRMRPASALRAE